MYWELYCSPADYSCNGLFSWLFASHGSFSVGLDYLKKNTEEKYRECFWALVHHKSAKWIKAWTLQVETELQCSPCTGADLCLSGCWYSLKTLPCCLTGVPGVVCCVVPQKMSLEIQNLSFILLYVGLFFAFKWFSALSSVRSLSLRTKVSLSLLLSPHHSSNLQFPRCFG